MPAALVGLTGNSDKQPVQRAKPKHFWSLMSASPLAYTTTVDCKDRELKRKFQIIAQKTEEVPKASSYFLKQKSS